MSEFLFQYHKVHLATWVYLSSLLMIGLFFKFNRFWSVRNVDLVLLILLSPGLLLVHFGSDARWTAVRDIQTAGGEVPAIDSLDTLLQGSPAHRPVYRRPETTAEPRTTERSPMTWKPPCRAQ
jgi:hypothetical protein